jgi:hypothetical protein
MRLQWSEIRARAADFLPMNQTFALDALSP